MKSAVQQEPKSDPPKAKPVPFSRYQIFVIAIITFIQFTVVLDFMVLSPLSAILLKELEITPDQFGLVVSAYAISAGLSGFLASMFADRFDRKKFLLFFYTGFVLGTMLCAIATNYHFLVFARIFTGVFGGVIGSVSFAIITDLFPLERRGQVMGYVQMAFASSQILGLPIGLYLANHLGWHSPFWMIVGIAGVVGVLIFLYMRPVSEHLQLQGNRAAPFRHLASTLGNPRHIRAFSATILLATGGYMLMPFGAAFTTANMKISLDDLPLIYLVTGLFSFFAGPIAGKISDRVGKMPVFAVGSFLALVIVIIFTNLGTTPLIWAMIINVALFIPLTSRMVAAQAMITAVPAPANRGAFMGVNASMQQISGGFASFVAGMIVAKEPSGFLLHYDILGYVVACTTIITIILMARVNKMIKANPA